MSLRDVVLIGIKTADGITKSLQPEVTFERHKSPDNYGAEQPTTKVKLRAIIDWKQKQLRTPQGVLSVSRASVLFLDIDALVKATNGQGIDDEDKITLPDGTTGPILDMGGFIDAGTGHPFATEVFLG